MSVQVAQAGGLAGFLHEGAELELLPGQKTHVLQRQRQRVSQAGRKQTALCTFSQALLGHHITCYQVQVPIETPYWKNNKREALGRQQVSKACVT